MMSKSVIIPSAKLVPIELQAEFGRIPSAMIPINSKPVLEFIVDFYKNAEYTIGVNEGSEIIKFYASKFLKENAISIHDVGYTNNLGETIFSIMSNYTSNPDNLIINFADTLLLENNDLEGDFIFYAEPKDLFRWTTYSLDENSKIAFIKEKNTFKRESSNSYVFIGVFGFSDFVTFKEILSNQLKMVNPDLDPFYSAILKYYNGKGRINYIKVDSWYDFGHLDTYFETKKRMDEGCREFNTLSVDSTRGIITKRSKHVDKFIGEIEWYLKLPSGINYLAPRVFNYSLNYTSPFVSLEYYGYPALNDLFLFGNLDLGAWRRILAAIEKVIKDMHQYTYNSTNDNELVNAMKEMYETKTIQRINMYINDPLYINFRKDNLNNSHKHLLLEKIIELIPIVLQKSNIYSNPKFTIIHGDLCMSNILYDRRNGIVRIIDPRGKFGKFDIYGDYKYDLAKLSHSFLGDYDFLVKGLFEIGYEKEGMMLNIYANKSHQIIKKMFEEMLQQISQNEFNNIRLLESLLFLSLVPLHKDRPKSQIAFLLKGIELFSKYASEYI